MTSNLKNQSQEVLLADWRSCDEVLTREEHVHWEEDMHVWTTLTGDRDWEDEWDYSTVTAGIDEVILTHLERDIAEISRNRRSKIMPQARAAGYDILAYGNGAAIELPEHDIEDVPVFGQYECELFDPEDELDLFDSE